MRIAHISDMHLRHNLPGTSIATRRLSRHVPALFEEAVGRIDAESPDLVVVTGDLVDYPLYALGEPNALARGVADLRLVADSLAKLRCPVSLVGGNHDDPSGVRDVFGGALDETRAAGHRVIRFHDSEVDSHVPQRMGAERQRYIDALHGADATRQIHVQHFLVWPRKDEGYPHTYAEAEHLRDTAVESSRVRLVLSGHYHPGLEPVRVGDTWFAAAPAFGEPPHRYLIHDLTDDGVSTETRDLSDLRRDRRKVVFLDRDGTINPQPSYRTGPEDMVLIPGAARALKHLRDDGFALVVVSNQSCVGHGFVTSETVGAVNDRMAQYLMDEADAEVDGVYCSHYTPDAVLPGWRMDHRWIKPSPGMLLDAADDLHLDLSDAYMVGDNLSDVEAGHAAGAKSILVRTGSGERVLREHGDGGADAVVADVSQAAEWILGRG